MNPWSRAQAAAILACLSRLRRWPRLQFDELAPAADTEERGGVQVRVTLLDSEQYTATGAEIGNRRLRVFT